MTRINKFGFYFIMLSLLAFAIMLFIVENGSGWFYLPVIGIVFGAILYD